jgi:hypothetical protein
VLKRPGSFVGLPIWNVPAGIRAISMPEIIVMENCLVRFPTALVAFTVKVDVPTAVGVPVIAPVAARVKPVGNVPPSRLHVMGVSPVAASVWLYDVPNTPPGNVAVVITGGATILMDNCLVLFPAALVAITVKVLVNVLSVVGVPVIVPLSARLRPVGNVPPSRLHVMGVSPVAASVWLYAVPVTPSGNVAVVIVGATPIFMENSLVLFPASLAAFTVK